MNLTGTTQSLQTWALNTSSQDLYYVEKIFSKGQRWLYRHRSQMGTVVEFNDGALQKVIVLDAKYRTTGLRMNTTEPVLPDYELDLAYLNHSTEMGVTPVDCDRAIDSVINQFSYIDKNNCAQNTNIWLSRNSEVAQYTRSILINGKGCDIPNLQTLQRIFCEAVLLDSLDPTLAQYPQYSLSNWFNNGIVWSSSEFGLLHRSTVVWGAHCLSINVKTEPDVSTNYVIPVLEL